MDIRAWDIQTLTSLKNVQKIPRRVDEDEEERLTRFNKSVARIKSASDYLKYDFEDENSESTDLVKDVKLVFNNKYLQITYQNNPLDENSQPQAFEKVELIDLVNGNQKVFEFDCRFDENNKPWHTKSFSYKLPEKIPEGQADPNAI